MRRGNAQKKKSIINKAVSLETAQTVDKVSKEALFFVAKSEKIWYN